MKAISFKNFVQKTLVLCLLLGSVATAKAALADNVEYYIWLNIYEKLLGKDTLDAPSLSRYTVNKDDLDSYVFVAEASEVDGYVLLRRRNTFLYLAASSSNNYNVVFESIVTHSAEDRFLWKVDEGVYSYLQNKKTGKYLGVDGANKSSMYVSVYCDKPKGSHSQFSVIPVTSATSNAWVQACRAYESPVYTNAQGVQEIDYCQLFGKTVSRSDAVDIHLTRNEAVMSGNATKVNLGSDRTWLIIDNIVPSEVIETYLRFVYINGKKAEVGTNCRVAIFLNGAAVIPLPATPMTCSGTNGDFTLGVGNHSNLGTQSNAMTSFVLRRGYMATLATGTGGTGYSRVYVADHADLEITLPKALTKRVSSVNVKEWQYLSKKGWGNTKGSAGAATLRASWYWSWSAGYSSTTDLEFVPCRQHLYWPSASAVNEKTASASLSLNEPEHSEQHEDCDCGGTIDSWKAYTINKDFMAGGGRIGSPQPTDLSYLTKYCEYVDNNASRCDFAVTHAYWDMASYNETDYANWFCNTQSKSVWNNTKRPLWITEMEISASWNTNKVTSYEQNRKYLQVLLQKIEECPWIERYAIYGTDMWQTYMFYDANTSKGLTPAGQVYRDHRSTFAYNANYTAVPNWWAPSMKAPTLDYAISEEKNTITFTIGNTNGDATDQLTLQRKVGDRWEDLYTVTDRSKLENSEVVYALSLDDIDRNADVFRVSATNLYGGSANSEEQTTGFVTNPTIVTASKSEVPGWTCVRNASAGYTKAASGDTYLEVWNSTAETIDFNYYQDITEIPNGVYSLSAVCFNSTDHVEGKTINGAVGLYAMADGVSYFAPVTADSEIDYERKTSIGTIVVRNHSVRIGIRNIGRMTGRWAGADDFELTYLGSEENVLATSYEKAVAEADQSVANQFPALENDQRDASGLIFNADCSRSTANFWTTSSIEINTGEAYDGDSSNPYFNIWKSGAYNSSVKQELVNLPAGQYTPSVLLRGSSGQKFSLTAVHTPAEGEAATYSQSVTGTGTTPPAGSTYMNGWQKAELEPITIHHGDRLTIAAEASFTGTGWWSVDHFQLLYASLPEQPTAISGIKSSPSSAVDTYYTLDGRALQGRPAPGVYILRRGDGTTRKVLVR